MDPDHRVITRRDCTCRDREREVGRSRQAERKGGREERVGGRGKEDGKREGEAREEEGESINNINVYMLY